MTPDLLQGPPAAVHRHDHDERGRPAVPTLSRFEPTAPVETLMMAVRATPDRQTRIALLPRVALRPRIQLVQQLITESPEDVGGFCRRDPDQAKTARPIRMKATVATPTMPANAARCRRAKTPDLPKAVYWQSSMDDRKCLQVLHQERLEVDDLEWAETTELVWVCTD
jgi:hypothetical protein